MPKILSEEEVLAKRIRSRGLRLKRLFNISLEEYDKILNFQNSTCAICGLPPKTGNLAVDHDHKTGLVRGLLCMWCNRSIAIFRDNTEKLKNAAKYLETPPASLALGEPRFGLKGRVTNKAKTRDRLNKSKKKNRKDKAENDN